MIKHLITSRLWLIISITCALFVSMPSITYAANGAYSDGNYGACTYNNCGLTLTSSGTVNINVIPGSSTTCTTQSDSVAVTTDSSTGYTMTLNDSASTSSMTGTSVPSNTIPTTSGSQASPTSLSANTWGYRVDGVGGFGSGTTTASSNVATSSTTFAAIPNSGQTPDTLVNASSAADPAVTTPVWYGICVNTATPADTYSSSVVYTAVVN